MASKKIIIGAVAHPNNDTITKSELIELIASNKIFIVTSTSPLNFDFHDFIAETAEESEETPRRGHIAEKVEKVNNISEILDFETGSYTTLCQKDDGYWAMTLQKISPIGVAYGINLHELLIQKYNNDHRSSGCTQPIVVSDDAWERITTGGSDVSLDEDDYYLSWHSQNEYYIHEPDAVIGYLPAMSIHDLLDGSGDWLSEMTPESPELEHGLSIEFNEDGGIEGWEVDDPSSLLKFLITNWDFTDEMESIRDDIVRFLIQKWS